MKTFLTLLVLLFSSSMFADDISDFEIEGMSVGDSLLDYMSEDFIKENTKNDHYYYLDDPNKYYELFLIDYKDRYNYEIDKYDSLKIFYKNSGAFVNRKNEKDYEIHGIMGVIYFPENYEQCIIKRNTLVKDLSIVFNNLEKEEPVIESHIADKTGNSTMNSFVFWFNNDDLVMVVCYDWTEQMQFYDNLKIQLLKNDLNNWLIGN